MPKAAKMKARVVVKLKEGVLDPQGKTIHQALAKMGMAEVSRVRQGKFFEIEFEGVGKAEALRRSEEIARKVLSNPIIENFEIEEVE